MHPILNDIKNLFWNTLFPITCLLCDRDGKFVCDMCEKNLKRVEHQRCIICQKSSLQGLTHPKCQTPHAPDALWSLYDYHDPRVSKLIIDAKYNFLPDIFCEMGLHLGQQLGKVFHDLNNSIVIPIPLKASRKRWRGFNQAELIAESMSKTIDLDVSTLLIRQKTTKVQKDLGKEERKLNIKDAFALGSKHRSFTKRIMELLFENQNLNQSPSIKNKNVILIDDVVTTGSTLMEAAKFLKRNDAGTIFCVTLAQD